MVKCFDSCDPMQSTIEFKFHSDSATQFSTTWELDVTVSRLLNYK